MRRKFYKTVIQVEILSEGMFETPCDKLLSTIEYDGNLGATSNHIKVISEKEITEKQLKRACTKHGTDSTFFLEEV